MMRQLAAALTLACLSTGAPALETIDEIYWPDTGRFPAYPAELDERGVRLFVDAGIDRDSNVFRLSDSTGPVAALGATKKSDTIYRVGAGLRATARQGRQRVLFDLQAEHRNFDHFNQLDHTRYRAGVDWQWVAGSRLSGNAGFTRRKFLADLGDIQANIKDMITEDSAFLSAAYLVTPRWRARGALDWVRREHDAPVRAVLDARVLGATAGLDYLTPAGNSVGGQVRVSQGEYPNAQLIGGQLIVNDYDETETSLVARWAATGKSTFEARAGYTRREHDQVPQRDFDGFTGRLDWDWFIANKTLLNVAIWRQLNSLELADAAYAVTEGWGLGPAWAPTVKLVFQARYFDEDRDYEGNAALAVPGAVARRDTVRGVSLTAGYTPRRNMQFTLGVERGDRDSNLVGGDYDYTLISASARLLF